MGLIWVFLGRGPTIEPGSILVFDLAGDYVEASDAPLLSRILGDERRPFVGLLSELRKAERDDRLAAVVLRVRGLRIGWAKAQELREAIASLQASGRRTVAYLEVQSLGANIDYFVASAAGEVQLAPGTRAPVIGLAAEYFFLGGLWEKLGVGIEVERIGRYKSIAEFIAGESMSEANREMANSLLDSIYAQFVSGIAEGRDLEPQYVRDVIDQAPVTPDEMVKLGFADGVRFFDQIVKQLGDGTLVDDAEYAQVDPTELGFEPVSHFALVYGTGAVVMGRGSASPTGGPVLAAQTVSQALSAAAADDDIDAIIFRIDSPGGSALASDVVWRATQRARSKGKPLIVSFSDVAASGGYYVAAGADAIVAQPASLTGSIGVVVLRPMLGEFFEKLGIGFESLTRGRHADMLLSTRPLSPSTRERLRTEVESVYDLFVERVADGRSLSPERVDELGRGRVYTGAQAVELGLVDELGGLRQAVSRAKRALEIDPDADVALIPFPPARSFADQLNDALRRVSLAAVPELPRIVQLLRESLLSAPALAPVLVPPFVLDIR